MKRVILSPNDAPTIEASQLLGREIVCYLSSKTNTPKILAKLTGGRHDPSPERWGFISTAYPTGDVVFAGDSFHDSLKKCLKGGRKVFTFEDYRTYREWAGAQLIHGVQYHPG